MSLSKYFRRNAYKWHRISSLVVAIPVMLWTISGFLHPVMSSMKPQVRNQVLPAATIDTARVSLPLSDALHQNNITEVETFRLVKLYEVFYYQVKQPRVDTLTYINCTSGTVLLGGDRSYAAHLAQRFLSEKGKQGTQSEGHHHGAEAALINAVQPKDASNAKARVLSVQRITQFNDEYKRSNRLLPVYRVAFDRSDSIRLYVETPADRLAVAIDNRKAWFSKFFALTHTWGFLEDLGKCKSAVLGSFSLLCFISGIMGFYVHRITNKNNSKKPVKRSASNKAHRVAGNIVLATTLLYAVSGAWHSFQKLAPKDAPIVQTDPEVFSANEAALNIGQLARTLQPAEKLHNASVVRISDTTYWQLTEGKKGKQEKRYLHTQTLQELKDGDIKYGCHLAYKFTSRNQHSIKRSRCLTAFNHSYSMMNKRLPVVEVTYNDDASYYVETASGALSAMSTPASRAERFSFSNLHMHHYWEMWLGKGLGTTFRNSVLIASTLGLMLAALTGMVVYFAKKRKSRSMVRAAIKS